MDAIHGKRRSLFRLLASAAPMIFLLGSMWPQEIEQIRKKAESKGLGTPALNSYDVNRLAYDASPGSIRTLYQIADGGNDSLSTYTLGKIIELYTTNWNFPEIAPGEPNVEAILDKWMSSDSSFMRRTACTMARRGGFTGLLEKTADLLHDPDYDVKLDCARTFFDFHAGMDDMSMVEEKYPQLLGSGYHEIKNTVLLHLGELKIEDAFPTVVTMIGSDNPSTRSIALVSAAHIDPDKAFPYVTSSLHDEQFQVRLAAVSALGLIRTKKSLAKLKELMDDPALRAVALKQIADMCTPAAVDVLLDCLDDKHLSAVAAEGLLACGKSAPGKMGDLLDETGDSRVLSHLLKIAAEAPEAMPREDLLAARDKISGLEPLYFESLVEHADREVLVTLLGFTESNDENVRLAALEHADEIFERTGYDSVATDVIINSISDESPAVRKQAAGMAGRWKIHQAAAFLKDRLDSASGPERAAAAASLLMLGEHGVDDIVSSCLFSFDSSLRRLCAGAVMESGLRCSEENLEETTRSMDFYDEAGVGYADRYAAAGAVIGKCRDAESMRLLEKLLLDGDDETSGLAATAAVMSSNEVLLGTVNELVKDHRTNVLRRISTRLWAAGGEAGRTLILELLKSPDRLTRTGALLSLLESDAFDRHEAAGILVDMLDDDFEGVRVNAMSGLAVMTGEASKRSKDICAVLDGPLTYAETLAALDLASAAGAADCVMEKLERLVLSNDRLIKKGALLATARLLGGGRKIQPSQRLRFGLAVCALGDPDEENRAICAGLLDMDLAPSSLVYKKTGSYLGTPAAYGSKIHFANIKKGTAVPRLKSGQKGASAGGHPLFPLERAVPVISHYPAFYPFFFVNDEARIFYLFKVNESFSGFDFESFGEYKYFDALNIRH